MNTLIKLIALFFFISVAFGEFQLMKKSRDYSEAVDYLTLKIKKTTCAEFLKKGGLGDRIRGGYSHHCLPVSSKGEDVDDLKFIGRCLNHDKDIILSIIEIHGKKSSDKNDKHNDDEKKYEKKGKIARSFTTREENDEKQFYLRLQAKEEPIEFKIKHFNLKNGHAYQVRRPACIKAKNHCETSKRSAEEMMVIDCLPRKQSKGKVEKDETVYIEITRRDERPDTCKDAKNGYCCRYVSASKNQGICKLYKSKGGRKDSNKGEGNKGQEYKGEGPVTGGVLGKLGQKPKDDAPGAEGNSYGETKPTEEKDIAIEYNAEEETKHQEESKHDDKAETKKEDDDEKRSLIKKTVEVPKSVAEVKSDEGEEFEIEDEEDPFKDEEKKDVAAPAIPVVEMKKVVSATESKDEIVQRSKKDILPLETKKESIEPVKKDAIEPVKVAVEQTTVLEMNQVENVPEIKEEVKSTIAKRDVIVGNKAKKEEDDFDLWSEINDDKGTLEEEEEKEKEEEKGKENKKESQPKKTSDNKKEEEEEEKEEEEKEEKEKLAEKQKEEDDEKKRNAEQKKSLGKTQQASAPEAKKEEKPAQQDNKKEEKPVAKEEKKQEAPAAKKDENKKQEATPKKEKSEEEEEKDEKEREMKEKEEDEKDKKEEEEEREREEKEEKEDKEKEEEEEREDKMKKEGSEEEEEEEQKKKEEEEEEKRNIKASPAKSADASTTNSKSNSAPATPVKNAPVVIDSKKLLDEAEKEMADEFAKKK